MEKNQLVINPDQFEKDFVPLMTQKRTFLAYFYGGADKQTGKSWCSDCDISKPNVEEAVKQLANKEDLLFVKLPIDDQMAWKDPNFLYRTHTMIKISKVPSLVFFNEGTEFGRLVEDELFDKENVIEFVKQIFSN
jgi:thiol-disulfide isomerase/thioredoxin